MAWISLESLLSVRRTMFTANGTFTVPGGVTVILVTAIAGGGGSGVTGGGGAGESISRIFKVTPGDSITITIGAGGSAGAVGGVNGGAGGNTQVGSLVTLVGGSGNSGSAGGAGAPAGAAGSGGKVPLDKLPFFIASGMLRLAVIGASDVSPSIYPYGHGADPGSTPQAGKPGVVVIEW